MKMRQLEDEVNFTGGASFSWHPVRVTYEEKPHCKFCGFQMQEWYAFGTEHFHSKCFLENSKKELRQNLKGLIDRL